MDPDILTKTKDTLGKLIKKPPLTDKLLTKPPFRFLHDIITAVIKNHGFMKGLYKDEELNSDNVKDKDSKTAFLQKAIDMVSLVLGKSQSVKPVKIIAGHEPEKTNEFLQQLAEAIEKKADNDKYVAKVLKGDAKKDRRKEGADKKSHKKDKEDKKEDKREDKKEETKEERRARKEKEKAEKEEGHHKEKEKEHKEKEKDDKEKEREERHKEREERHKEKERKKKGEDEDEGSRNRRGESADRRKGSKDRKDKDKSKATRDNEYDTVLAEAKALEEQSKAQKDDAGGQQQRPPRPTSAKGSRRRQANGRGRGRGGSDDEDESVPQQNGSGHGSGQGSGHDEMTSQARRAARPGSARPAPPRVVKKNENPEDAAPQAIGPTTVPHVIMDKDDDDDEEDAFITKEDEMGKPMLELDQPPPPPMRQQDDDDDDAAHGGLVKKMMKTKVELEGGSQVPHAKKTEIDRSASMTDATLRKEREMVQKEIDKLRLSIQTLTRSVNPLGKIMDFVQEDLDSMAKEREMWQKENRENTLALQREQSVTESLIEPMKAHLQEIEAHIEDQLDLIAAVKANILKNDDRQEKMLGSITKC